MEMLRVGDEGEEDQKGEGVGPPDYVEDGRGGRELKVGEVGDHQDEDEQGDEGRFPRDFSEPFGPQNEAAESKSGDGDCGDDRERGGEPANGVAVDREEWPADADGEMIERDEAEGAKSPEDEGVEKARNGPLLNDLGLADDLPEEVPNPAGQGMQLEVGVRLGLAQERNDDRQTTTEAKKRQGEEDNKHR